jgi:uncharacterized protein YyaL (SSP411 family)
MVIVEADGVSDDEEHGVGELEKALALHYLPFAIQLRVTSGRQRALAGSLPFIGAMQPVNGATAVYVCRDFTCRQPVTTVPALEQELGTTT